MTLRRRGYDSPMNVICQSLVNLLKRWALFQIHGSGDWVKRSRLKRSVANLSRRFPARLPDALGLRWANPPNRKTRRFRARRRKPDAGTLMLETFAWVWFCGEGG